LATTGRGVNVCLCGAVLFGLTLWLAGCGQQPIAIVNGQKITRQEFLDRLKQAAGQQVLTDLIYRRLVEDAFARAGLQVSEQEVEQRLEEIRREFPSPEAFEQMLAARGYTLDDVKRDLTFELKLEKLRTRNVKYSEADLRKYFEERRRYYDRPLRVTISQIVVSTKQEADKIAAELKKPGANFAALARLYSTDAMFRAYGGRLPEMPLDRLMPPEAQKVVRRLQVGQISEPFAVLGNWYIIKLEDLKPPEKATFEKVRAQVERDYRLSSAQPVESLLRELANQAAVQVLDPQLASVQQQFMPRGRLPSFGEKPVAGAGQRGARGGAAPSAQPQTAPQPGAPPGSPPQPGARPQSAPQPGTAPAAAAPQQKPPAPAPAPR
jgi:foldase protein PrsA